MSMTLEDAWREEAYDRLVKEIIEDNRDEIIDEFVSCRMASYYDSHKDLTSDADRMICEAEKLFTISPSASLVFSRSAVEITLRDVLLKPVAFGMVHDETAGALIADLVIGNQRFTSLLFSVLEKYGFDIRTEKRAGISKTIWEEMEDIKKVRNEIVHYGKEAMPEQAELSLKFSKLLLKIYRHVREQIVRSS